MIPHENLRENAIRRRRDPISGVEVRNVGPEVEMVVGQDVPRALGITETGGDGVRPANPQIGRIHMAHVPAPVRVEVATGAMMAGVEVKDMGMEEEMGMLEDIIGTIDPVASRCLAAYPSTNAMGKSLFVCGCTKWCTTLPLLMPRGGNWYKDWSRTSTKSISRKCGPCAITLKRRS